MSPLINVYAQVSGCTDPLANNFDPDAVINDGSCTYNLTLHNPDMRFLLPSQVDETSGLAIYDGRFYTINDSGGEPIVYGIDSITGEVDQMISVEATNIDWESLAMDDEYMYIGDFGNNSGTRDDLLIYRISLNDIPDYGNAEVIAEKVNFTYSDYKKPDEYVRNHNFDCEAFIATDSWLYLFSKNRGDHQSKLYRLPKEPGEYVAELVTTFNINGLITGADINQNADEVTLIGYTDQSWIPFIWLLWDFEGELFYSGNKRRIDMPNIVATQTEAIAYSVGKNEVLTSEGNPLFTQAAYNFNSAKWTSGEASSTGEISLNNFDFVISPNPVKKSKINIDISTLLSGDYQLEIFDTSGIRKEDFQYKINKKSDSMRLKIKLESFKPGVYFIRITSGSNTVEKKFIVL